MGDLGQSGVRALCSVCVAASLLGCEPNHFSYDRAGLGPDECDLDSCGEPCPPGSVGPDENGDCAPVCMDTWSSSFDGILPHAIVRDGDDLLLGGELEWDGRPPAAWIARMEGCGGMPRLVRPLPTGSESSLDGVALVGEALLAVGSSKNEGTARGAFATELDRGELTPTWTTFLAPSATGDRLVAAAAGGDALWAVGSADVDGARRALAAKVAPSGTVCSFTFGASPGELGALAVSEGDVVAVGREGPLATLHRIDGPGCSISACGCQPAQSVGGLAPAGADAVEPLAVALDGSTAYVVGSALQAGAEMGFVMAVDFASGTLLASRLYDAGPGAERLTAVATAGTELYAAGTSAGRATLVAFSLPLDAAAPPSWTAVIDHGEAVTALAHVADGAALLAGVFSSTGGSAVLRCTDAGICPSLLMPAAR